jgi:hypothetical protein
MCKPAPWALTSARPFRRTKAGTVSSAAPLPARTRTRRVSVLSAPPLAHMGGLHGGFVQTCRANPSFLWETRWSLNRPDGPGPQQEEGDLLRREVALHLREALEHEAELPSPAQVPR